MKKLIFLLATLSELTFATPTRTLLLNENDVGEIRTAIRYSTMLEFDSRPLSVILGDQDAFKVEYVGNSLTIKPILPSSQTNLFVMTDYEKFNFKLRMTNSERADYKVRVKKKAVKEDNKNGTKLHFRKVKKTATSKNVVLELSSIATPKSKDLYLITFSVGLLGKNPMGDLSFKAEDFHVLQGKVEIAIDNLSLDALELTKDKPTAYGSLILRSADLKTSQRVTLLFSPETSGIKPLRITVQLSQNEKGRDAKKSEDRPVFSDGNLPL